jgi:hypothetical protein
MPKREPAPEKPITTTVAFDRVTYKQLRLLAVERETNVRDLIRDAVRRFLRQAKSGKGGRP